jgi:transposase
MQAVTTIGLDIAKSVFQIHGVDAAGQSEKCGSWALIKEFLSRRWVVPQFEFFRRMRAFPRNPSGNRIHPRTALTRSR